MSALDKLLLIVTIPAAMFVLIRAVCMLNAMTRATPKFVFIWYWADAAGAVLVLATPFLSGRPPTIAEAVFVVGCAIAFVFDKRQRRATRRPDHGAQA